MLCFVFKGNFFIRNVMSGKVAEKNRMEIETWEEIVGNVCQEGAIWSYEF